MQELSELSRIGFGCYRISRNSRDQFEALNRALVNGCNLIDTSVSYTNGDSEKLIGELLTEYPCHDPFIITKAGYAQGESLLLLEDSKSSGTGADDLVQLSNGSLHSIEPDFLDSQIKLSCNRLRRSQIDGFLLHNPEYYFDQVNGVASQDEYYSRIKKAFEFLEENVDRGCIRYYGISSNTFPFSTALENTTSLPRVLALAKEVSASHHFKLIQFPFNLIENDAQRPHHQGSSLIEIARSNGIVTLSNRPLNANSHNGPIRLATYEKEIRELDEEHDRRILEQCLNLVQQRLDEIGIDEDVMEFVPIQVVSCSWASFSSPDVVDQVFDQHLLPFLNKLYEGSIVENVLDSFAKLRRIAVLYAKSYVTRKAMAFRQVMIEQGTVAQGDGHPLPVVACQSYLDAGIDHVLVGMRSPKYVDSLVSLF